MKKMLTLAAVAALCGLCAAETNLARNKTVTSSSNEKTVYAAKNAVDGNIKTRWSSQFKDNQWIQIDLGKVQKVGKVVLKWEVAYAKEYKVQLSMDGKNFTDAVVKKNGKGKIETLTFAPADAKFVRIFCVKRATGHGSSLWEVEVYSK